MFGRCTGLQRPNIAEPAYQECSRAYIPFVFSERCAAHDRCVNDTDCQRVYAEDGITDTQYLLVRHLDQPHPHCHLVYNRVGNNGQTISDKNIKIRNAKVCRALTEKYGCILRRAKNRYVGNTCGNPTKRSTKYMTQLKLHYLSPEAGKSWKSI